jgi:hypothetical protein
MSTFRTDTHNNPTAFTTDVAAEARLILGTDYTRGDPFQAGHLTLYTARLIGDPIALTIRVIDLLSFSTQVGNPISRWGYITMPQLTWNVLTPPEKRDVIGWMYQREGGTAMRNLFPNYGKP